MAAHVEIDGICRRGRPDLNEQIQLFTKLGIKHVEFRSAWGTKVLDLSEEQLAEAKRQLDAAGISMSSVGSDVGKIQIIDPFEEHLERAAHAVEVAKFFGSPYIRMFSFFIPEGDDPDQYREEVMARTREFVQLAEAGGVTMLHENEKDIYGDIPRRVVDLVETMGSQTTGPSSTRRTSSSAVCGRATRRTTWCVPTPTTSTSRTPSSPTAP